MSKLAKRVLYWTPRILSIAYVVFLGIFAMDVFEEHLGFLLTVEHLTIHLIPSLALLAVLILAWRWEWVGTLFFGAAGSFYIYWLATAAGPVAPAVRLNWALTIAGPAFLIALLFLFNWLKHGELRTPTLHAR